MRDGRRMLMGERWEDNIKRILKKYTEVLIGFICLGIGTSGGLL
jgi:hypothetical protein